MKKKINTIVFSLSILFIISCSSSKRSVVQKDTAPLETNDETDSIVDRGNIRFVFYNVENLFDTKDDTIKNDEEFLPWGMKAWNTERYEEKLKKIFKVLVNIGGWELPDMIGLCEIENRFVLEELIKKTPLSREGYGVIHEESPDRRGIDLGFIYKKASFLPLFHEAITIHFPFDTASRTRDLLYIEGLVNNKKDTLHIFLCHFPSRLGGQVASEPRRIYVATQVRTRVDSILISNPNANIIITGDFNDEPLNNSIINVLQANGEWENLQPNQLHNYMHKFNEQGKGTYKFDGYWDMIDQFMISKALTVPEHHIFAKTTSGQIFERPWLMEIDAENPGDKPFRTYGGSYYYGGYSDHLPIYLDIFFKKN